MEWIHLAPQKFIVFDYTILHKTKKQLSYDWMHQ